MPRHPLSRAAIVATAMLGWCGAGASPSVGDEPAAATPVAGLTGGIETETLPLERTPRPPHSPVAPPPERLPSPAQAQPPAAPAPTVVRVSLGTPQSPPGDGFF